MRFRKAGDLGYAKPAVTAISTVAAQRPIRQAEGRHFDDPEDLLVLVLEPHQRPPDRDASHKASRSVNRIDDPPEAGRARLLAVFFSQKAVAGKGFPESFPQKRLSLPVGLGH